MSDLGWYLQDFENAAITSKKLHQLDKARLVDYERILHYYDKSNAE